MTLLTVLLSSISIYPKREDYTFYSLAAGRVYEGRVNMFVSFMILWINEKWT